MVRNYSLHHVGNNGGHSCILDHWQCVKGEGKRIPRRSLAGKANSEGIDGGDSRSPLCSVTVEVMTIELTIVFSFRNGSAIGLPVPPITALITPGPVRHCQIPDLPVDGSLLFEFLFFIYLLVALFIQYINIYKTVWWYPYNHPASCTSLVSLTQPLSSLC